MSQRPTVPRCLSCRHSLLSQRIHYVPPHARLVHAPTAKAKIRSEPCKCALLLPRRSPSQKRTSGCGLLLSNTSSSDGFPKFLTAKRIGTKDRGARTQNIHFRWSKISNATGDRCTPCQVTNRVQKYLKKLKLCGVKGRASVAYVTCDTVLSIFSLRTNYYSTSCAV